MINLDYEGIFSIYIDRTLYFDRLSIKSKQMLILVSVLACLSSFKPAKNIFSVFSTLYLNIIIRILYYLALTRIGILQVLLFYSSNIYYFLDYKYLTLGTLSPISKNGPSFSIRFVLRYS